MPAFDATLALTLGILFGTAFCRATFGFGDAVISMPLLILVIGASKAAPVVALIAFGISGSILATSWRSVDWRSAWRLLLASVLGTPFGVILLRVAPESTIKGALGFMLVGFGLYSLFLRGRFRLQSTAWAFPVGFVAGILGSSYNTNAPPVVVYGSLRGWSGDRFRSTLQGYLFPAGVAILLSHYLGGLWTREVFAIVGLALPLVAVAFFLGTLLSRRLDPGRFDRLLYIFLVILGALLAYSAF